jgi:cellulose synthase (UDP-forming)
VLASGLGPEDMGSYVSQQLRWARGCLSALPRIVRARLPFRQKAQYLLSGLYWMSGWTVLVYMAFPTLRLLFGIQPLEHLTAPDFLLHFAPYFLVALTAAALAGGGAYTFGALALAAACFWVHIVASVLTLLGRRGSFKVTPKVGATAAQPGAVWPTLLAIAGLVGVSVWGLSRTRDAATLNNVAFAAFHVCVLLTGCWSALRPAARERVGRTVGDEVPA